MMVMVSDHFSKRGNHALIGLKTNNSGYVFQHSVECVCGWSISSEKLVSVTVANRNCLMLPFIQIS